MDKKRLQELAGVVTEGRAGAERWYEDTIEKAVYRGVVLGRRDMREEVPEAKFKQEIENIVQEAMDTFNEGY